ncbi:MAG: nucleotidyltransferase domain-containing protein [Acidobacteriota bacterium]
MTLTTNEPTSLSESLDYSWLVGQLDGPSVGVMLYGSYARGDQLPGSDIDVVQLVKRFRPSYQKGKLSASVYTYAHLRKLSEKGSLFILHLLKEGQIVVDPQGDLKAILEAYRAPPSYDSLRLNLRAAASILDVDASVFLTNPSGFSRLALYLLRTEAYTRCVEVGHPTFSMAAVAQRLQDSRITECFQLRAQRSAEYEYFCKARNLMEEYLGCQVTNPYGTIEAFSVNMSVKCPFASVLALRIIRGEVDIEYENIFPDVAAQ